MTRVDHTFIISDIHLSDAEPPHPGNPLWKRFKRPRYFIDRAFRAFLDFIDEHSEGKVELVLNGDIFDFDSVMVIPEHPSFKVSWLERIRGLSAEEAKSRFKASVILNDHHIWTEALREFVLKGNQVVFVIGNHDMEVHWPGVQQEIMNKLSLPEEKRSLVRFCEWFYVSNQDTLIEHGNQYDAYCLSNNPLNPLIKKGSKTYVRLPFGNIANKFMMNGMGLFNPHSESNFIMSLREYVIFFYKYVMRTQPFLIWTWFWGAIVTLVASIREGLLPALKDPLMVESRVEDVALKANTEPRVVRSLRELHVHPAIFNPIAILRELWLDRAFLLLLIFLGSLQFYTFLHTLFGVSIWWFLIPTLFLLPAFVFYARTVESEIFRIQKLTMDRVPIACQIAKDGRGIHGHTHREMHTWIEGVEYLNTGSWSAAYKDPECTVPIGRKCFAWIHPNAEKTGRVAQLLEWTASGEVKEIPPVR